MNDTSHSILRWTLIALFSLVPVAAVIELIAALFVHRVRAYILSHRAAHLIWFALALLFAVIILFPAYSTRNGNF